MLLIMIVSVTAYGHRLAQQVQASQREREQAFQKLQLAEAFLREQTAQLEHSFNDLQAMQARLVESEKMSALGVMVAGVAHEINNPVNFIHGNLRHAQEYSQDLLDLIRLYRNQEQTQDPGLAFQIQQKLDEVDIDFLEKDLPKLFQSMQAGTNRIREIVKSLRNFSRLDEAEFKAANLHEGIDSTLMILHSRLKETPDFVGIRVIKDYGALPFVDCYPGQLNQVFMNILTNAIDALEDSFQSKMLNSEVNQTCLSALPTITIRTEVLPHNSIAIRIADNGPGIPASIQSKIFDPFFTTKSVGKGTGLGLSISYKIVVEKHGGRLQCHSQVGQGTEFVIEIPILQPESAPSPPAPSNTECNSRSVVQIRAS
jgi:signal transduction histidine kinase